MQVCPYNWFFKKCCSIGSKLYWLIKSLFNTFLLCCSIFIHVCNHSKSYVCIPLDFSKFIFINWDDKMKKYLKILYTSSIDWACTV